MARINLKVSTGEQFTVSNAFYGRSGPMTVSEAEVQMSFILTKLASIDTDQGHNVNTAHIVYQWISA